MPGPSDAPRTMAALNADIVGYSRLIADDVDATTAVLGEYRRIVESEVRSSSGTLVNFVGDNFMAVFDDVKDAVHAAIAISTRVEERNEDVPSARVVRFRMGIDLGEVIVTEDDHHGDALNIAARIQAMAPEGGLSVSGRVYRALDEPALRFRAVGRHRLKNIPERVDVYEFADLPSKGGAARTLSALRLETPTIAVLPIHTEGADEALKATAAVIRSDVLHRLVGVPTLRVIDVRDDPEAVHGGPAARYMLDTGVHRVGDDVRVYATLFDVSTVNVVDSHKWMVKSDEVLAISDELADEVAHALEVELVIGEPAGLYADLEDPDVIEKVYRGWYHLRSDTPEGWMRALELFDEVAESRPDLPFGDTLAAFTLWAGASNGWAKDPHETLLEARRRAHEGMRKNDRSGLGQAVEAAVLMSLGKVDEALEALDGLEIVRPTCDVTYGLEGSVRRYMGQWERAVELLDTAMRLTGVNKPWYPTVKACSLFVGGEVEEAGLLAEAVLEHQPNNLEAMLVLAAAQSEQGLERRARATADLIKAQFPSVDVEAWLAQSPYQSREFVRRWMTDLTSAGAIDQKAS